MENSLDNTFFAKIDDETRVVLIPSHFKSLMEKSLIDFREKNIFKFETDEVKRVRLRANKIIWEAVKKVVVKNARFDYLFRVDSAFLDEFPKDIRDWKPEKEK